MELLNLPHELLILICAKLDSCTKIKLSKTCQLFNNLISEKSLVTCTDLSGIFNSSPDDLQFIVNHKLRCQNITILNIDNWYWVSRQQLYRYILKLPNLKELYAMDTKLQIKDIVNLQQNLLSLSIVAFSARNYKVTDSELNSYEHSFRKFTKIYVSVDNSTSCQKLVQFLKRTNYKDKFEILLPQYDVVENSAGENVSVCQNLYDYRYKYDEKYIFSLVIHCEYDLYHKVLQMFLPDLNENFFESVRGLYVFTYKLLEDMKRNSFQAKKIRKLCIYGLEYNFKRKKIGDLFHNIHELYLNCKQLYDISDESNAHSTNEFKKRRVGVSTHAENEEEQPIRSLTTSCPNLEVLCIRENINVRNDPTMKWFPNCLKSISLWRNLKYLALTLIEVSDGKFLEEISYNCLQLEYLLLSKFLGYRSKVSCFGKELCKALPRWKHLQYFFIEQYLMDTCVNDIVKSLTQCYSLKYVVICNGKSVFSGTNHSIVFENLKLLISNLNNLFLLQIIDASLSVKKAHEYQLTLKKHFSKQRPRLWVSISQIKEVNCLPMIFDEIDIRRWSYWLL